MKKINAFLEKHELLVGTITIALITIFAAIALSSCVSRGSLPPEPEQGSVGLFSQLESIGGWFIWIGLLAAGLGVVARLAGIFFVPLLAPFSTIFGDIAEIGIIAAAVGGIFVWLSAHAWLVILSCVVAAIAWAYCRRHVIRRWLDAGKKTYANLKESHK